MYGRQQPLSFELSDTAPGPYEKLETSEAVRMFEQLLERMDDNKREVFVLSEVEQLTAPEIGELLGNTAQHGVLTAAGGAAASVQRRRPPARRKRP